MRGPSNAGGLIRWPVKLVLPVGFALMALQGISELIKRIAALTDSYRLEYQLRDAAAMIEFVRSNMAPLMFGGLIVFMLFGYPAAFSVAAVGLAVRLHRHRARADRAELPRQSRLPGVRHRLGRARRAAAGDPVLHLHGRDPRTQRARRGPAGFDRAVVRAGARRPVLCGDLRRRDPRRHHRHGGGVGDRHGGDRAAADDALRLFDAPRHRRDRRIRHHHPAHSAVAGADRARRPARPVGRRHVCRRDRAEPDPDRRCSAPGC